MSVGHVTGHAVGSSGRREAAVGTNFFPPRGKLGVLCDPYNDPLTVTALALIAATQNLFFTVSRGGVQITRSLKLATQSSIGVCAVTDTIRHIIPRYL